MTKPESRIRGAVAFGVPRISLGFVFLWAFLDKAFALGFSPGRNAETGAIDFFGPEYLGLGRRGEDTALVKRFSVLK